MPGLAFRLIGPFGVLVDDRAVEPERVGSRKARLLLEMLVVERGRLVSTDRIVDAPLTVADDDPSRSLRHGTLGQTGVRGGQMAREFAKVGVVGLGTMGAGIQRSLYLEFREPRLSPARLLRHLVPAGYLGRKTGRGFRDYSGS